MNPQHQLQLRKDLPATKHSTLTLTGLLALGLVVPAAFAAEPPAATPAAKPGPAWGAAEVQPTPENPVYFRWTLGHFPGAQPPLEFWDGAPVQVEPAPRTIESKDRPQCSRATGEP